MNLPPLPPFAFSYSFLLLLNIFLNLFLNQEIWRDLDGIDLEFLMVLVLAIYKLL